MDREAQVSKAIEKLSRTINRMIERSPEVGAEIAGLRELGFEPNLSVRLEITLEESASPDEPELELTPDDIRTLQRMKIIA